VIRERAARSVIGERAARTVPVVGALTERSLLLIPRMPASFIPSLVFPIITLVAFNGAFGALVYLPGFPVKHMLDWILPMSIVQGTAFTGVTIGVATARDLESGFYDRLLVAPVPRRALLAGPILAALARGYITIVVLLIGGILAGARMRGGPVGAAAIVLAALGATLLSSAWGLGISLRIRSQRAAPLMQFPVFMAVFLSTAQVPLSVMTGWLHAVARVNPTTQILRLARAGFIGPVAFGDVWPGIAVIAAAAAGLYVFAARGLRKL
jgi:ABC-2 type transport system permease protein